MSINRIGILTGGGDCPGMNAVIRAVTRAAIYRHGIRVFGIEDGFLGLIENRIRELTGVHVAGILVAGGTVLGTNNRANPARFCTGADAAGKPIFEDLTAQCLRNVQNSRLDALIVIGGDGTMSCAAPLVKAGVNCIGVPKTIDNDIVGTDITFGFLTAANTATEAMDKLHSTAMSHHRVMVCEVMGRNAGWIALHSGLATGADVILIPEIPFSVDKVCEFIQGQRLRHRGYSIIACAEGARPRGGAQVVAAVDPTSPDPIRLGGIGKWVASQIAAKTGIETRTTVLGHIQRGGTPVPTDRVLATQFGHHAIELLMANAANRMAVWRQNEMADVDIEFAANKQRLVPLNDPLIDAARAIRTCFGD